MKPSTLLLLAAFTPLAARAQTVITPTITPQATPQTTLAPPPHTIPSLTNSSPSNLAGVLHFCVQNNYLTGGDSAAAAAAEPALLQQSSLLGNDVSANISATAGRAGLLDPGDGQDIQLGGTGDQAKFTQQACETVLSRAQALL